MKKRLKFLLITLSILITCMVSVFTVTAATSTTASMPSAGTASLRVVDISQWNDSVSNQNDNINFSLLKSQVDAVYIRAIGNSNGVPYIDTQAARFAAAAQNVNLNYGFYYYFIPKSDIADTKSQARAYYYFVKNYAYSCIPALDVEENPNNLSKADLAQQVKVFNDEFKALSGFDLMIYSYPDFMKNNFDPTFNWSLYKLWIAHYNVSAPMTGISSTWMPQSLWCWDRWDMWQYTSSGTLSSVPSSSNNSLDISQATDNILLSTPMAVSNIDSPSSTGVSGGNINISGWALSHSGVSRVDIYTDNFRWVGSTSQMTERPDVQQSINGNGRYNDGLHSGFSYTVDASFFTAGQHSLILAVINRNGTVDWVFSSFTVAAPGMCLDTPTATGENDADIAVSGWAVSHAGIARADIYIDNNQWMGTTDSLGVRNDVNSVINSGGQYLDAIHSGFSYIIDSSRLTVGTHVIKVAAISRDGTAQWTERTFTVGPDPLMCLDSPTSDATNGGDVTVSGWALNHSGIKRVDIYVDNNRMVGSTANLMERRDVNSIYNSAGQFKNGLNSGFTYTIDAGNLTVGVHTIKVAAIGNDGSVQWVERTFTVGPQALAYLDSPAVNGANAGDVTVSGWALSHSGILRADIYMDNNLWVGSTSDIYTRPDVNSALNSQGLYKDGLHSGFTYTINKSLLTTGTHIVRVAVISKDGSVQWVERTFNVGLAPMICLDSPTVQVNRSDSTAVSGWAVSRAGVSRVDIYMDANIWVGSTNIFNARPDVNSAFNGSGAYANGLNCGFSYIIEPNLLTIGTHIIRVAAISNDGSVQWMERTITVQ